MIIKDFRKADMEYLLRFHPTYKISGETMQAMEDDHNLFTAFENDEPILCGGIRKAWAGRGELWAMFGPPMKYSVKLHKNILKLIAHARLKRTEMTVHCENKSGHKLAKVLGFKLETERMKAYRPDGGDCAMYVRISDE